MPGCRLDKSHHRTHQSGFTGSIATYEPCRLIVGETELDVVQDLRPLHEDGQTTDA